MVISTKPDFTFLENSNQLFPSLRIFLYLLKSYPVYPSRPTPDTPPLRKLPCFFHRNHITPQSSMQHYLKT